jgi:hypothetical protein
MIKVENGITKNKADTCYLKLNQSIPQTVSNGAPIFSSGLTSGGTILNTQTSTGINWILNAHNDIDYGLAHIFVDGVSKEIQIRDGNTIPFVASVQNNNVLVTSIISSIATGTQPYACTSTTLNTNLNADLWDGYQFADYLDQAVKTTSSPTFANITDSGLTASELVATDANKKLVSLAVATYPSLTEISYVKGVTSAIQTQFGNKQPLDADLTAIAALGFTSTSFLKKTAADTWALDTNTYLTSVSGQDHSTLANLSYAAAGHTGFEPTVTKGNLTAGSTKITIGGTGTGALIGGGASVDVNQANLDHGSIGGLSDNDHTQYVNAVSDTASLDLTLTGQSISGVVLPAGVDHGGLGGMADDDHTQYALLVGRNGGQTLIGGTGAGDDLTLQTTSNASKGTYFLSELTSNGFVKTSGGTGAFSIDTNTYLIGNQTITLSGDVSGSGATAITTAIGADKITEAMLKAVDAASDEDILTYEITTGDFEWHSASEVKTAMSLNLVENTALSTWAGTTNITTLGTIGTGTWNATTIGISKGGTGQTTASAAFNALSPMTTLGDIIYGAASGAGTRLAGNTATTRKFLRQTGDGVNSAAPAWDTLQTGDIPDLSGTYQPLDTTLTSLAAYNTNGLLTQTAADTFTGRAITGTANQITVTNGDGVAGNPTLSTPQNIHTGASPTFANLYVPTTGFVGISGAGGWTFTSATTTIGTTYTVDAGAYVLSSTMGTLGIETNEPGTDYVYLLGGTEYGLKFATNNSATPTMTMDLSGNVGIGTMGPDRKLDILDASNPQFRLTHTDGSKFCDFKVDTNHDLTITPSSTGQIKFQPTTDSVDFFQILDADGGDPIFNVNSTDEKIGFFIVSPAYDFDVVKTTAAGGTVGFRVRNGNTDGTSSAQFVLETGSGGNFLFNVYGTTTVLNNYSNGDMIFSTNATERMRILSTGQTTFSNPIRLKGYTVATLPTGTQGDTAFVTDATAPTYLGTLTGGGAVVTPVFYNGTAWVSY